MDSKLVIEQMAGRWKIKHPDMRPLAIQAQRLAPFGTIWTWVPRAENQAADRLANLAMDAAARGEVFDVARAAEPRPVARRSTAARRATRRRRRWSRLRRWRAQPDAGLERPARRADHAGVRTARRDAAYRGEEVLRTRWRRPGPQRRRLGAGAAGRLRRWRPMTRPTTRSSRRRCSEPATPPRRSATRSVSMSRSRTASGRSAFGDWDGYTLDRGRGALARPARRRG